MTPTSPFRIYDDPNEPDLACCVDCGTEVDAHDVDYFGACGSCTTVGLDYVPAGWIAGPVVRS